MLLFYDFPLSLIWLVNINSIIKIVGSEFVKFNLILGGGGLMPLAKQ
jgi:hypothetical protein